MASCFGVLQKNWDPCLFDLRAAACTGRMTCLELPGPTQAPIDRTVVLQRGLRLAYFVVHPLNRRA
jgi:hypothetical protein